MPASLPQPNQQFTAAVQQLPPLMKQLLENEALSNVAWELYDEFALRPEQFKSLVQLEGEILVRHIAPVNILDYVLQDVHVPQHQANAFTAALLGKYCLPMQWYIGNVESLITQLGGNVDQYLQEARKKYPEVYAPKEAETVATAEPGHVVPTDPATPVAAAAEKEDNEPMIVKDIEKRLTSSRGRAEVLLRLTALSQQIESQMKAQKLSEAEGQELLRSLDALSYAVNTQDLNPLEVAAIKRRLKTVVAKSTAAS